MKDCLEEGILQSYFDGELSTERAESVASHLASCSTCAQAGRELESGSSLVSRALEAEFGGSVPTERLRQRVEAAIAGLYVVRPTRSDAAVLRLFHSLADLFALRPRRAFSYAGLALVIVLAAIVGVTYWKGRAGNSETNTARQPATPTRSASPERSPEEVRVVNPPRDKESGEKLVKNIPGRKGEAPRRLLPGEQNYIKTIAALDATIKSNRNNSMRPGLQVEYERNLALVDHAIAATRDVAKKNPDDPNAAQFMFAAYQSKVDLLSQVADARLFNKQR